MNEMLQLSVLKDTIFHKSQIAFGSHFDWLIKKQRMGESRICSSRMVPISVMGRQQRLGARISKERIPLLQLHSPIKWVFNLLFFQTRKQKRWAGEAGSGYSMHEGWLGLLRSDPPAARHFQRSRAPDAPALRRDSLGPWTLLSRPGMNGGGVLVCVLGGAARSLRAI